MNILPKPLRLITALFIALVALTPTAEAAPRGEGRALKTWNMARQAARFEARFLREFSKLSPAQQARVLKLMQQARGLSFHDADGDGLPDDFERGKGDSNLCDDDSDDDGLDDGDDEDPDDSDSDDDGHEDGDEREEKGIVSERSDSVIVVNGVTFLVTESTEFEDIASEAVVVGSCIEIEGHQVEAGDLIADEVESSDGCDDDDHDDD